MCLCNLFLYGLLISQWSTNPLFISFAKFHCIGLVYLNFTIFVDTRLWIIFYTFNFYHSHCLPHSHEYCILIVNYVLGSNGLLAPNKGAFSDMTLSFKDLLNSRRGSRILKRGVNFFNNVIEPKPG